MTMKEAGMLLDAALGLVRVAMTAEMPIDCETQVSFIEDCLSRTVDDINTLVATDH